MPQTGYELLYPACLLDQFFYAHLYGHVYPGIGDHTATIKRFMQDISPKNDGESGARRIVDSHLAERHLDESTRKSGSLRYDTAQVQEHKTGSTTPQLLDECI